MSSFLVLISAEELAHHVQDKNWIILDCRHDLTNAQAGRNDFAAGHIPRAQFAQLDEDLSGNKTGTNGRHPLPDRAAFIATLRSWGINEDTQVVAYDAHGGMFAARCWWMLRWVGHSAVAVLDGGLPAWLRAQQISTDIFVPSAGSINDKPSLVKTVTANDVLANIDSKKMTLVDARSPDRFRGENETLDKVGGHIPGAKNRFFKDNLQADGSFKTAEELRAAFGAIINQPEHAIMQCGSGVTACHNLLSLEVAGMSGAVLYPGSWSEWCTDSARPMAAG